VSGRAAVEGGVPSLAFLDEYLSKTRWVRLEAQGGRVAIHLKMQQGKILPESRLQARPDRLIAYALDYKAEGEGRVVWEVLPDGESRLALDFARYQLTRGGRRVAHVRGRNLHIAAMKRRAPPGGGRLFSPRRFAIEMPTAEVPDLSFYNAYLPGARDWS
jgi:hypothetical protein